MNNREIATVIWLGVALAACLLKGDIRAGIWQVVKCFCRPLILGMVAAVAGWTFGLVVLAHAVGIWEGDERNDTVTWLLTVGLVFLFSLRDVERDGYFRRTARRAVEASVFVEVFVNLAVFPLLIELVLLPVVVVIGVLHAVTEGKDEQRSVHRLMGGVISILGLVLLVYGIVKLTEDFDAGHTLRALALPVWLTFGVLPFIYVVGLWSAYQQAFWRIDIQANDAVHRRRAKRALLRAANVRAAELGGFAIHWISDLASADSDEEARNLMRRWRATWRSEARDFDMEDARDAMTHWRDQTDPVLAGVVEDAVRRSWDRLDREQRVVLREAGMNLARAEQQRTVLRGLPL